MGQQSWLPQWLQQKKARAPFHGADTLPKASVDGINKTTQAAQHDLESLSPGSQTSPHRLILSEFAIIIKASIPVILAYALQNSLQTISVIIVGRGSAEDLAVAAFSYMFAMATAWLIALGGTTAMDTLASSSFTGSKDPKDVGVLLQRAFVVLSLFYVPVIILWVFSEKVFLALGQEESLSRDSARFLWYLIPGGLGYIYFESMKKYLQAQGKRRVHPY